MTEQQIEELIAQENVGLSDFWVWHVGGKFQVRVGDESCVRDNWRDALQWCLRNSKPKAEPPPIEAAVSFQAEPAQPVAPQVDELAEMKARLAELEDANAALRDALSDAEEEIEALNIEPALEPEPEPEASDHFADLMLADETADDARARLSALLKDLRHVLMTPSLQVNEDGSTGLTERQREELTDLERRQAKGRWLDA